MMESEEKVEKKERFSERLEKWVLKNAKSWKFWLWSAVAFLSIVQVLFAIPAPVALLDAAWEAGDFISFVGTIILGYIAMRQTQRANKMAEDANKVAQEANETSRKLIQLQEEEYTPVVTVSSFAGIKKFNLDGERNEFQSEMVAVEMRDEKNNVSVGYSLAIPVNGTNIKQETHCRAYELHLVYSGHFVMSGFKIKSITFINKDFTERYPITKSITMSLCDKEKLTLQVYLFSNEDFTQEDTNAYKFIKAHKFVLEIEMVSMQGRTYSENIVIEKMLIAEPEPVLQQPNIELMLSATYQVNEQKDG